jgi:hypothetical protein
MEMHNFPVLSLMPIADLVSVVPPVLHGPATLHALGELGEFAHEAKRRRLANVPGVTAEYVGAAMVAESVVSTEVNCDR